MCGIAGIALLDASRKLAPEAAAQVRAMTDAMICRGPDGEGVELYGSVCLGHRRLSIIDLAGGAQPMQDASGAFAVVFNGEIYNFKDIRKELEARGAVFQTRSDTEVLLEAYKAWGTDCLPRFDGMFAFALWDGARRRLFCARDRFGKKPFFYTVQQGRFVFASELKCLKKVPELAFTPDPQSLSRYLAYQYVPCPATMFREASQIPPSHALVLEEGRVSLFRWWDMPPAEDRGPDEQEAMQTLRTLMQKAVARRMVSDVPLGVFLSGGIDSSIVAGLMATQSAKPVETFSIGFTEASYDESAYARCVAEAFKTRHHERILSAEACADILPDVAGAMDVPMADASCAPTWLLSKTTREHVTVALGGDGADELWAGYEHYIGFDVAERYNALPGFLRTKFLEPICRHLPASSGYVNPRLAAETFLRAASRPAWQRIQSMLTAFTPDMQAEILASPDSRFLQDESLFAPTLADYSHWPDASPLKRAFHVYAREFLLDDILVKVDRCSMLHSLEVRAPFLDRDVVDFVCRLPVRFKLKGFRRKYLLKKAFASLLPEMILKRNKRGFQIPVAQWLRGRMRPLMEDLLGRDALLGDGFFEPNAVRRLMDDHISGRKDLRVPLWTLMVFQLWWRANGGSSGTQAAC